MFQDVDFEAVKDRKDLVWIDVRSENEFAESTIPGAVNVPLFNNEERAQIGTLYKQVSPQEARMLGLEFASRKLPDLYRQIKLTAGDRTPVLFCWRGGMRSKSLATILDLMGVHVLRLAGGYRGYRGYITAWLEQLTEESLPPFVVVHGMTGVGKTTLLRILSDLGEPVLDLEGLAGHRGSVFGAIGLRPANQRQFDSALYEALLALRGAPYLLVEAESKRIGHAFVPEPIMTAKRQGINIELVAPTEVRVNRTLEQYRLDDRLEFHMAVTRAIGFIEKRFSPDLRSRIEAWLQDHDYVPLIRALLEEYYDPRYLYARKDYFQPFQVVDATDLTSAADQIRITLREWLKNKKI